MFNTTLKHVIKDINKVSYKMSYQTIYTPNSKQNSVISSITDKSNNISEDSESKDNKDNLNAAESTNYSEIVSQVLSIESQAILRASARIAEDSLAKIVHIFEILANTGGQLVFCGVGKSGLIGQKLASTFCSLGRPSFCLHPTEALHGDLGRLTKSDALVIISKSGTTEEIRKLLPFIPTPRNMMIGLIGNPLSPLAEAVDILLDCSVEREACINDQAPTTSTIVTMAMGDALAVLYEQIMGISKEKFAINHPGGILGKSLRLLVRDLMIDAKNVPIVSLGTKFKDVIIKMTEIPLGICVVRAGGSGQSEEQCDLMGIVVDGDIRRIFSTGSSSTREILETPIGEFMNKRPITIGPDELAYRALELMEKRERKITVLPVVKENQFLGIIRLHGLLGEGFFLAK